VTARPAGSPGPGAGPAVAMLARSPLVAGKTRLTAGLDASVATVLRTALLLDTIEAALGPGWPVHVYLDPASHAGQVAALIDDDAGLATAAARVSWHPQGEGDLGQRMTDAVRRTTAAGHDVVVLVGSDLPDLPGAVLAEAGDALAGTREGSTVVFGPAADGGFYLVAATDAAGLASAFAGVAWSQETVLNRVTARLTAAGVTVKQVRPWHDIDDAAGLAALALRTGTGAPRTRRLLRAIPSYNQG